MKSRYITDLQDTADGFLTTVAAEVYTNFFPSSVENFGSRLGEILAHPALTSEAVAASSAQSGPTSVVSLTTGGIIINLLFDAAAMAAPAYFRTAIQQAASILTGAISDHITVNIMIDYSGTGGGAAAGPDNGLYQSYSSVWANLTNHATPGDTIFNALPSGSSIQGQSNVAVWNAQLKLWGVLGANDASTDDGSATFATDINPNLLVGVALHELTHAMGRIPYGPQPDIFDLFRFTSVGNRLFSGSNTAPAAYFSIDGGHAKLADYGKTSDPSDFLNSGVQGPNDPFNEYYTGNTIQALSAVDKQQLDALGFHLVGANHAPVVTVPSPNVTASAGKSLPVSSLFSGSDADGDTLTYYLYDGTAAASSGHFVVNGTIVPAQTIYQVSAAQLAQTTFVAGANGTSDDIYVEAFDGQAYSGWNAHVNVAVAPNHAPTVSLPSGASVAAGAGQSLQASSLFSGSDADGDTLTYYLYDGTAAASSGHFVVNGTALPNDTMSAVTAAQLAQTTFVAGAAGTNDDLFVKVYDGHVYTAWSEFHVLV
jgi:hypothetical protein